MHQAHGFGIVVFLLLANFIHQGWDNDMITSVPVKQTLVNVDEYTNWVI